MINQPAARAQEVPRVRVVGSSEAIRRVEREALLAARGDTHVLITGERGVGKAALARFIHEQSGRSPRGFSVVHCKDLTDQLFESTLFGHVQGAFAGAYRDKPGLLESLRGGTVLLDEVGALSPRMQARLLRFLETGESVRIGVDRIEVRHHVRVIASTTANLPARVAAGLFLDDLHARLNAVCLSVPPLRERRDDIPSLVDHFVGEFVGQSAPSQSDTAGAWAHIPSAEREALCRAEWPGNVRELKSVVLRQLLGAAVRHRAASMVATSVSA